MTPEARAHQDAARALAGLDLTDLGVAATDEGALALCAASRAPRKVAAVWLWSRFVDLARRELAGSGVKIATLANFPSGEDKPAAVRATIEKALHDGADDVDVVMPCRRLIAGKKVSVTTLLRVARAAIPAPEIMGRELVTPSTFCFGASALRDALGKAPCVKGGRSALHIDLSCDVRPSHRSSFALFCGMVSFENFSSRQLALGRA